MRRVAGAVGEQVVGRHIALDPRERLTEVVGVREGAPAGVGGQRGQRILRGIEGVELLGDAAAGEHRVAAPAGLPRVPARHDRLKTPGVDGVEGHVAAHRGVDRRPELDLIVLPAALHVRR